MPPVRSLRTPAVLFQTRLRYTLATLCTSFPIRTSLARVIAISWFPLTSLFASLRSLVVHNQGPPPTRSSCPSVTQHLPPLVSDRSGPRASQAQVNEPSPVTPAVPAASAYVRAVWRGAIPFVHMWWHYLWCPYWRSLSTCSTGGTQHQFDSPRSGPVVLSQFSSWDSWSKNSKTAQTTFVLKWLC